jgi:hypothetical protein
MPEGDNDRTARFPEGADAIDMQRADSQRPPQRSDRRVADRWQYRELQSSPHSRIPRYTLFVNRELTMVIFATFNV